MHYYSFNIGDYRKDTSHLNLLEHGIYRQLIDLYYLDESPLTSDIKKLSRLIAARTTDEVQALHNVLEDFFELYDGEYKHGRCDLELKNIYDKSEKAKKSAQARWDKKSKKHAKDMLDECERNANACKDDANASKSDANGMLPIDPITHLPIDPIKRKKEKIFSLDELPPNVSHEKWEAFMEVRKKLKAAQTHYALITIADKLKAMGDMANTALDNAIANSWKSVFLPKEAECKRKIQRNGFANTEYTEEF